MGLVGLVVLHGSKCQECGKSGGGFRVNIAPIQAREYAMMAALKEIVAVRVGLLATLPPLLLLCNAADARPKARDVGGGEVPALEATLVAAGWTMTPERSASYTVGDIYSRSTNTPVAFKADCFEAEPRENAYTSLEVVQAMKAGARVPLGMARFKAEGMEYKQLKFAEPYMTELADMHLLPNEKCQKFLASRSDLADLFVIKAVLSAEVKEQLCRSIDAAAGALGFGVNAAAQQECAQASEGHVAVAYKTQEAASLLNMGIAPVATPSVSTASVPIRGPVAAQATTSVDFGGGDGGLDIAERLRQQRCDETAKSLGEEARSAKLANAEQSAQSKARTAWVGQSAELEMCVGLERSLRSECIQAVQAWLRVARAMVVTIPSGVETIETDCGTHQPVYPAVERTIVAADVNAAERILAQLQASDTRTSLTTTTRSYGFSTHTPGASPSYSCAKASMLDEHIICSHSDLARLDKQMAQIYFSLRKQTTGEIRLAFTQTQRDWVKLRGACETHSCINRLLKSRISELPAQLQRIQSSY